MERKGSPLDKINGASFTYLVKNVAFLLNAVNALSSKYEEISKLGNFLDFFTAINSSVSPFRSLKKGNDRFPSPFIRFNLVKSPAFHIPVARRVPLLGGVSPNSSNGLLAVI